MARKDSFRLLTAACVVALLAGSLAGSSAGDELDVVRQARYVMGTIFEITARTVNREQGVVAIEKAFTAIRRSDEVLSHYRADSDLSRLNDAPAGEWVAIQAELHGMLERSWRYTHETRGAFRPTVGSLVELWKRAEQRNRRPTAEALAEAVLLASPDLVEFEKQTEGRSARARRIRPGVRIEFGAIGKGWAVDQAAAVLRKEGIRHALVDAGTSTMRGFGNDGAGPGWAVAVRNPTASGQTACDFNLVDAAVSTSASDEQYYEIEGTRYSHIVDPRTGIPAGTLNSATVIAPSATQADALSTAVYVLGLTEGPELLARLDLEGYLIDSGGGTWANSNTGERGLRWR